jgi:hypothetical protein
MSKKFIKLDMFDVEQITEITKSLRDATDNAEKAAKAYSEDKLSQMAFQIGYLQGHCKTASDILSEILKQK